jgi:hypothetical protein
LIDLAIELDLDIALYGIDRCWGWYGMPSAADPMREPTPTRLRPPDAMSVIDRFLSKTTHCPTTGCLLWIGGRSRGGDRWSEKAWYGTFNPGGVYTGGVRAHVYIAWLLGLIPDELPMRVPAGFNLDHTCHNALCVDPWHLELVPAIVNQHRKRRH